MATLSRSSSWIWSAAFSLVGCGVSVQTTDGSTDGQVVGVDGSLTDGQPMTDGPSRADREIGPDGAPICEPFAACDRFGPEPRCPVGCGFCGGPVIVTGDVMLDQRRYPRELARCINPQSEFYSRPGYRGRIQCDEPAFVTLSVGPEDRHGSCIARADCARINEMLRDFTPGPDETVSQCRNSDGTLVVSATIPANGACHPDRNLCSSICPCMGGRICAFISERVTTGVCVPKSELMPEVSRACRAFPNRILCPADQACLIPIRGSVDMPDRERWGVCMPTLDCGRVVASTLAIYNCDTSLRE